MIEQARYKTRSVKKGHLVRVKTKPAKFNNKGGNRKKKNNDTSSSKEESSNTTSSTLALDDRQSGQISFNQNRKPVIAQDLASLAGGANPYSMAGDVTAGVIDQFNTDPTAKNYEVGTAASEALKYGSMGMALGPVGAVAGLLVGGTIGAIKGKKNKEAAEAAEEERKKAEAAAELAKKQGAENAKLMENMAEAGNNPYDNLSQMRVKSFTKSLAPIKGLTPHNMSLKQYNQDLKNKKISGVSTLLNI